MDKNIEILLYIAIGLINLALIVTAIYLFDKKNKFDKEENELILRVDYIQVFVVGILAYFIAFFVVTELIHFKILRLVVVALLSSLLPLWNMSKTLKTIYFKKDRIIVYWHFNKKTKAYDIDKIKEVNIVMTRQYSHLFQFGITYYYSSINSTYTNYFRGVYIDDLSKLKKYFEDKDIAFSKPYKPIQ